MILARLIEPTTCKAQVPYMLGDLGLESVSVRTLFRFLGRCVERGYREAISQALCDHVTASGGLALCLYDVTTLYFEAEREDDLRRVGDCQGTPGRSSGHRGPAGRPPGVPPPGRLLGGEQG